MEAKNNNGSVFQRYVIDKLVPWLLVLIVGLGSWLVVRSFEANTYTDKRIAEVNWQIAGNNTAIAVLQTDLISIKMSLIRIEAKLDRQTTPRR